MTRVTSKTWTPDQINLLFSRIEKGASPARASVALRRPKLAIQNKARQLGSRLSTSGASKPPGSKEKQLRCGHDKHRVASRTGQAQARILAMLFLTLRGTPFFFAGDELGVELGEIPKQAIRDPFEKLVPGFGLNRDPERTDALGSDRK